MLRGCVVSGKVGSLGNLKVTCRSSVQCEADGGKGNPNKKNAKLCAAANCFHHVLTVIVLIFFNIPMI